MTQAVRPARAAGVNPLFLGVVIGILIGIVIALAVALYINRAPSPFVEKSKGPEPVSRNTTRPTAPVEAPRPAEKERVAVEPPKSDGYTVLPPAPADAQKGKPQGAIAMLPGTPLPPGPQSAAQEREAKAGTSRELYWLQAGAFVNPSDADKLKAQLAFMGLEAIVRPITLAEKGTLYRVRLGPYRNIDDVNRVRGTLANNGVTASVIKAADEK